jgi:hypothetical protein
MIRILFLLLLSFNTLAQNSWVRFEVMFDFYGPSESNFFMVSNNNGDTAIYVEPTDPYEFLDTILPLDSGYYTVTLNDSYGDGWTSQQPAWFKMGNLCQGALLNLQLQGIPFTQLDTVVHVLPCPPPLPPTPPAPPICETTIININLDQYPEETSWDIKDSTGAIIISGGTYNNVPDYQPQFIVNCLPVGELTFTIYDTYGDGIAGSLWGGQDGSYYVIQCSDTLVYGTVANFGNDTSHVFISDTCIPPPPVYGCTNDDYVEYNPLATIDDSSCATLKIYGCTDSTMFNYDSLANTMEDIDSCGYTLILHDLIGNGWVGTRLEIWQDADTMEFYMTSQSFNQSIDIGLYAPAKVHAKLFVSQQAQHTALECGFTLINPLGDTTMSIQPPFIVPFKTYHADTYCGNICEEKVYGCLDSVAFNYVDSANTAIPCYYYPGCISPAYLEYHIDTARGYYTDINIQDSCVTLAVFGCTDSLALNYDSLANTNNGSCIAVVEGCMDVNAYNYNAEANTNDYIVCLYAANCITGPGNPYWLNDLCYAWVLEVDDYCCENEWDTICQATYDYCNGTWSGPLLTRQAEKKLVAVTDLLGRPTQIIKNKLLLFIYSDGSVTKQIIK